MAFEFTTVSKPVIKRKENPFLEIVGTLDPVTGDALQFEMPLGNEKLDKELRVALRQLTEAGNENDVTVRRTVQKSAKKAVVTFWAAPKVRHNRKEKAE